ncbi:MAG: hypothetical protein KAY37_08030 [Phycisphaerae bacterium]|nr:hypothetical protein [Phycisphaerae bacterium]
MTETTHTRSRRASLGGLFLQMAAFFAVLAMYYLTRSQATYGLAWYMLGGVPIWFATLLVFRQRELAALEALDLEELRREKQATGGGEAIFGEEGGAGLGFRVAENRLKWMQRWLIPGFGLATVVYLALMGLFLWRRLAFAELPGGTELVGYRIGGAGWPALANIPIALVVLAIVMLGTFLLSRYTSGMGRVKEWGLLRGCGSYLLGNALAIMVLMVCLGVALYTKVATWEQALAYILPVLMIVLAVEMAINFVLDIYRPRTPGAEPRACFDSRLLGLFAEPGGIASSIAEALNYQFGFQVSQTWFYQLLKRAFVPLLAIGALALWLLTCLVVVQPYEHVIIERFGRQINAGGEGQPKPYGPGLHFKWPWPIETVRTYNTGELHQISIGWKKFDAKPKYEEFKKPVLLWTDKMHYGQEHFDFMICRPPESEPGEAEPRPELLGRSDEEWRAGKAFPVHMMRMEVAIQYRIWPDELHRYSQSMVAPHRAIRDIAWEELVCFNASSTADYLMGKDLGQIGAALRRHISERVRDLGLEVVYVGVTNVHPEKSVAESYREVIGAEQEKLAAIREAWVIENQRLSAVAGDAELARALAKATGRALAADERLNTTLQALREAGVQDIETLTTPLMELAPRFRQRIAAAARLEDVREREQQAQENYQLGLGQTLAALAQAGEAVREAETSFHEADADLQEALVPIRAELARRLDERYLETLLQSVVAGIAGAYWDAELDREFSQTRLGGQAAAKLAAASAERWQIEMKQAADLVRAQNERPAYRAAPQVYKARRLMEVLVEGLKNARKYFLAFDPKGRTVRVRFILEDQPGMDYVDWGQMEMTP